LGTLLQRARLGPIDMLAADRTGGSVGASPPGCAETMVAFGAPRPIIRHRFGGHLRAVRTVTTGHAPHRTAAPAGHSPSHLETTAGPRAPGAQPPSGRTSVGGVDRATPATDAGVPFVGGDCMKLSKFGAFAAIAVLAFSACSSGGGGTSDKGTIQIWSELPRQGSSKGQSDSIVNAINFKLSQINSKVDGWTIKYTDQDDSTADAGKWTQERATALATDASQTNDLVGYIGTFNSGAAKIVIPVLCTAGIPMVSPANTYPGLTKPGKGEANEPDVYYPSGCKHNYFRVVPADDLQGDAGANWAKTLGVTSAYVLDDTEIYGKGIADVFEKSAPNYGITVLGHDQAPGKQTDYKALAAKIAVSNSGAAPDLVYYGGITQNNAGQLWKDLRQAMPNVKLMGPDGIYEDAFLQAAGDAAEGTYLTFGGTTADQYQGDAAKWRDEFKTKYGDNSIEVYTIYGYEAANVLVAAIETASKAGAKDAKALRSGTIDALLATKDFKGVLGTWSFDQNGDTSNKLFSGTQVVSGKFEFKTTIGG
jgi:branched-chain amino acid transport system substrate-binding protein